MNVYFQHDYGPPKYIVNFYKLLQIVFGIDLGAFKWKSHRTKCVAKCLSLVQCSMLSLSVAYGIASIIPPLPIAVFNIFTLIQYIFIVLHFSFRFNDYYLKFWRDIKIIDLKLKDQISSRRVARLFMTCVAILLVQNIAINCVFCINTEMCTQPMWFTIIYGGVKFLMTVMLITNVFVYVEIYYRLSFIVSDLKTPYFRAFPSFQHIYKMIVDVAEKYKCAFDPVHITTLLGDIPQTMLCIYETIWQLQQGNNMFWSSGIMVWCFYMPMVLLITLAPALTAGKLSEEAREIKIMLHDKLLAEKDETKCREIERFIRYVEARPLKFALYKVLPLDANLLGMVLHFCVTYLIVIAQFMHLY